jgi:hypothetical protein
MVNWKYYKESCLLHVIWFQRKVVPHWTQKTPRSFRYKTYIRMSSSKATSSSWWGSFYFPVNRRVVLAGALASGRPPMPDRSKGRGHTKCCFWSSRLEFGRGAYEHPPPQKTLLLRNHGVGRDPHRVAAPAIMCPKRKCQYSGRSLYLSF